MRQLVVAVLFLAVFYASTRLQAYDVSVKIEDEALNRFASAVAASEVTDETVWRIESPRFVVTSSGIRLEGRLAAYVTYQREPWSNYKALVSKQLEFLRRARPVGATRLDVADRTAVPSRTAREPVRRVPVEEPGPQVPTRDLRATGRQTVKERVNPRELALLTEPRLNQRLTPAEMVQVRTTPRYTRVFSKRFDLAVTLQVQGQRVLLNVAPTAITVTEDSGETLASVKPADYFSAEIPLVLDASETGGAGVIPSVSNVQTTTLNGALRVRFDVNF